MRRRSAVPKPTHDFNRIEVGYRHHRVVAPARIADRGVDLAEFRHHRHRHGVTEAFASLSRPNHDRGEGARRRLLRRDQQSALASAGIQREAHAIGGTGARRSFTLVEHDRQLARLASRRFMASSPIRMPTGRNEPKPPCTRVRSLIHSSGVSARAVVAPPRTTARQRTTGTLVKKKCGRIFVMSPNVLRSSMRIL